MKKLFCLLLVMISLSVKSQETTSTPSLYLNEEVEMLKPNELVAEMNVIQLESTDDFLIGRIDKIKKDKQHYYILDNRYSKSLYKFDNQGKAVNSFKNIGGGANEYIEIADFDIDKGKIALLCYPNKVIFLDANTLEVIKVQSLLEGGYSSVALYHNNLFLYNHYRGVVNKINLDTQKQETIFSWTPLKGYVMSPQSTFYKCAGNLFMKTSGGNVLYKIENDKMVSYLTFEYDKRKKTEEFYSNREIGPLQIHEIGLYPTVELSNLFFHNGKLGFIYSLSLFRIDYYSSTKRQSNLLNSFLPMNHGSVTDDGKIISWSHSHEWSPHNEQVKKAIKDIKINLHTRYSLEDEENNPIVFEYTLK